MACIVQFAPALAATATQFARGVRSEMLLQFDCVPECAPLHMNWVAVTDNRGNRKLEIRWVFAADERSSHLGKPSE